MKWIKFGRTLQLIMILIPLAATVPNHTYAQQADQIPGDPLGSFESTGPPALLNWTGDGQRIINPSFETGNLNPWIQIRSNTATLSSIVLLGSGYDGAYSVLLTTHSGNASSDSSLSLLSDLTTQQVGFSASIRLRAAFYVENITGTTSADRVEVSLTLTNSTGFLRTIHYFFAGTGLPVNSTSDAYYRITGSTGQWITIDRNIAADALARFGSEFASLNSIRDARLSAHSKTTGNDPRIKYYDTNSDFSWDPGEPVIYDGNNDRYYQTTNDQIIDTPPPGTSIKTDARIKFVDTNTNGVRDNSEPVVYDNNNNGVYDILEPVIFGTAPFSAALSTDSKIKYHDVNGNDAWNIGEAVVYDNDSNNTYDLGELVIDGPAPSSILQDDARIRFVDGNNDRIFNTGESIIYDLNNDGFFDTGEPVVGGTAPPVGTRFAQTASARFDRVELYSATGNFEWIRNNGFETGTLAGWGAFGGGFQATSLRSLSGTYSANATVTGGSVDMAQSLDGQPKVESWSRFRASAYVTAMTGSSAQDYVDIWLGLVDSSPDANPAFVHYIVKTGDGTIPGNTTSSIYHRVGGFGALNTWLSISSSLDAESAYFNIALYTPPFHLLVLGVQVSAQTGFRTTAQFDDFSFFGPYHPGPFTQGLAQSYRYAVDAMNSTYVYTAAVIPHGTFYTVVPRGLSILNITAPGNISILGNEYTTTLSTSGLRIDIPVSTSFRYNPTGDWKFYMTSINAVVTVYPEDPLLRTPSSTFEPGSTANLVSKSRDPFGAPIVGATATLTLWNSSAINVGSWTGTTDAQGWFNMSTATLPSAVGSYRLQATINATFVGVLTYQFFIGTPPLIADFTFTPASPIADSPVTFTATASGGREPYTFSWNFGDQTTGTGSTVTHTYSTRGVYQVSLIVSDARATTKTVSHAVSIHYVLTVSLETSTSQLSAGTSVAISGQVNPAKQDVTVTLSYRVAGDATWTVLGTVQTGNDGRFSYTWTPNQGDYELRASVGDSFTAFADSNRGQLIVSGPSLVSLLTLAGLVIVPVAVVLLLAFLLMRRRKKGTASVERESGAKTRQAR